MARMSYVIGKLDRFLIAEEFRRLVTPHLAEAREEDGVDKVTLHRSGDESAGVSLQQLQG
jgi:hypothetical protein